jgi:hypothetical protein
MPDELTYVGLFVWVGSLPEMLLHPLSSRGFLPTKKISEHLLFPCFVEAAPVLRRRSLCAASKGTTIIAAATILPIRHAAHGYPGPVLSGRQEGAASAPERGEPLMIFNEGAA